MQKTGCRIARVTLKASGLQVIIPDFSNGLIEQFETDVAELIEQSPRHGHVEGYAIVLLQREGDCLMFDTDMPDSIFWDRIRSIVDPAGAEEVSS